MKACREQLALDFVYEWQWEEQQDRENAGRRNEDVIWRHMLEDYPVTEAENLWLPAGIRLARHVHGSECHECDMDRSDHCQDWKWEQPVCLKDVRIEESRLGHALPARVNILELMTAPLTALELAVFHAFPTETWLLTSVGGLSEQVGMAEEELRPVLGWLALKGAVHQVGHDQFHITGVEPGRRIDQ